MRMNKDNVEGVLIWRDDEIIPYGNGTYRTEGRWFAKTTCYRHTDTDSDYGFGKNPVYCIWKLRPYRTTVFFTCIEARYFIRDVGEPVFCKNTECPNYDDSIRMNKTEYLISAQKVETDK